MSFCARRASILTHTHTSTGRIHCFVSLMHVDIPTRPELHVVNARESSAATVSEKQLKLLRLRAIIKYVEISQTTEVIKYETFFPYFLPLIYFASE